MRWLLDGFGVRRCWWEPSAFIADTSKLPLTPRVREDDLLADRRGPRDQFTLALFGSMTGTYGCARATNTYQISTKIRITSGKTVEKTPEKWVYPAAAIS